MSTFSSTIQNQNADSKSVGKDFDREQWKQQKHQELEETFQQLNKSTFNLVQDPERYKSYLDLQAILPALSVSNTLLILEQKDTPVTQLGSFNDWKDQGRTVRRGELGYKILSPATYTRDDGSEGTSFRVSRVFDISQTQGPEVETPPMQSVELTTLIKAMVENSPVEMTITDQVSEHLNAQFDPESKKILVRSDIQDNNAIEALAREMAQATLSNLHHSDDREEHLFASISTAYLIGKHYGHEPANFDPGLVQDFMWPDNPTVIRSSLNDVRQAFNMIRQRIDRSLETPSQAAQKPSKKHQEQER